MAALINHTQEGTTMRAPMLDAWGRRQHMGKRTFHGVVRGSALTEGGPVCGKRMGSRAWVTYVVEHITCTACKRAVAKSLNATGGWRLTEVGERLVSR